MSNVAVCVRFRPGNAKECEHGLQNICAQKIDEISFDFKDEKEGQLSFSFDRVFYESSTQLEVFEFVAMPVVRDAMNAINGTILTYGQTGAGKTYSMEGPNMLLDDPESKGILPRVVQSMFEFIGSADPSIEFIIKLSMVEIYMEKIRDLFDSTKDNLQVKEDKARGIFVAGATEAYIQTEQEMLKLLKSGVANRAVAATQMNAGSSRSHCVFMITIQQTSIEDRSAKTGKLFLVDLAGSEKVEKTGAEGKILTEAKTINKSLSALGNVINALTSEKTCHIPYRDSRLTRILQESLGGNSRTTLLCCCSPSSLNSSETLSTLRFGTRAKQIKNKPKINSERGQYELEQLLSKSERECEVLRSQVIMLNARLHSIHEEEKTGISKTGLLMQDTMHHHDGSNLMEKLRQRIPKKMQNLEDIVPTLENMLNEEGLLDEDFEKMNGDPIDGVSKSIILLQNSIEDLADTCDKLTRENQDLHTELVACEYLLNKCTNSTSKGTGALCNSLNQGRKARVIRPLRGGNHGLFGGFSPVPSEYGGETCELPIARSKGLGANSFYRLLNLLHFWKAPLDRQR